jgi:hypothetical protein
MEKVANIMTIFIDINKFPKQNINIFAVHPIMLAFKCNDFTKVATGGQNNYSKKHVTFINNLKAHQRNKVNTCTNFHLLLRLPKLHQLALSAPF